MFLAGNAVKLVKKNDDCKFFMNFRENEILSPPSKKKLQKDSIYSVESRVSSRKSSC